MNRKVYELPPVKVFDPSNLDTGRMTKLLELSFVAVVPPYTRLKSSDSHFTIVNGSEEAQSANRATLEEGLKSTPDMPNESLWTIGELIVGEAVGFPFSTVGRGVVGTGEGSPEGKAVGR